MVREHLKVCISENEIVLNTPKRLELLRDGPPPNSRRSLLGRGAFGIVFKATYGDRNVAVKIIKNTQNVNCETLESERNILNWQHPNIIRIFKIEATPKYGLVIMEHFVGQCLQKIIDTIHVPILHRLFILRDVVAGLAYCHGHGILHLDIKPQNVLVSLAGSAVKQGQLSYVCKLCDFGASLRLDRAQIRQHLPKGTVRYMAPEALRGRRLTAAADVYSLGVTMWQLATRNAPYYWIKSNDEVIYQVVTYRLRPDRYPEQVAKLHAAALTMPAHDACFCSLAANNISDILDLRIHAERDIIEIKSEPRIFLADMHGSSSPMSYATGGEQLGGTLSLNKMYDYFYDNKPRHADMIREKYAHIYKSCWSYDYYRRISLHKLSIMITNLIYKAQER